MHLWAWCVSFGLVDSHIGTLFMLTKRMFAGWSWEGQANCSSDPGTLEGRAHKARALGKSLRAVCALGDLLPWIDLRC